MFQVRMSEDEMATIETAARKNALATSSWARSVLLKAAAVALLLALALPARALDHWTWQDTAWEAGFAAAVVVDIGQTRTALNNHRSELNPILGRHPSQARLVGLAASSVALHAAISAVLPTQWRRPWQALSVGVELGAVGLNSAHVGFRLTF